jgi:hypothetical protein
MKCQVEGCRDEASTWCHASCCSGETGLCEAHYKGSRHERAAVYERYRGEPLPSTAAWCGAELARQRELVQAQQCVVEQHQKALADLMRIEQVLADEMAAY